METVEVVIRLPKEQYENGKLVHYLGCYSQKLDKVIYTGTVLPKGHGQVDILEKITNLFNRWNNGEIDDNQYHFQMQNLLLFGNELLEVENEFKRPD